MKFLLNAFSVLLVASAASGLDKPKSNIRRPESDMDVLRRELQFIPGYDNPFASCEAQKEEQCMGNQVPYEEWANMLQAMDGGTNGMLMEMSNLVGELGDVDFTQNSTDVNVRSTIFALRQAVVDLEDLGANATANQASVSPIIETLVAVGSTLGIDLSVLTIVGQIVDEVLAAVPNGPGAIAAAVAQTLFTYAGPFLLSLVGGLFGGQNAECDEATNCIFDEMVADMVPSMVGAVFEAEGYKKMEDKKKKEEEKKMEGEKKKPSPP